jgi:uncharacterized repeat protein (TIGR03803 family)
MKKDLKRTLTLALLMAGLGLLPAGRVAGQTFNVLHDFDSTFTNGNGGFPHAGLLVSGNTLYGGTSGMVFKVNKDGTGFTKLCDAGASGLTLAGNVLYGTDFGGGTNGRGTIFKVNTDGTGYTLLHEFTYEGSDGYWPFGSLVVYSNTLYGTTRLGGNKGPTDSGYGTIFKINTDGTGFTTLHQFMHLDGTVDGAAPQTSMVLSGSTLYGIANTVFRIDTDGSNYTNFDISGHFGYFGAPRSGPVLSGQTLYAIAHDFANTNFPGFGTVYAINTDGSGLTNLVRFPDLGQSAQYPGIQISGLVLSGTTLYGTMCEDNGSVFMVNTDGTGFTYLHNFTSLWGDYPYNGPSYGYPKTNSDGCYPQCLVLSGNTLYGLAQRGGIAGEGGGTLFSIALPVPSLTMTFSGTNASLSWPASATGFTLQSTTDLVSRAWSAVPTPPVPVNGQNTVSDPLSSTQRFYRLIKPD